MSNVHFTSFIFISKKHDTAFRLSAGLIACIVFNRKLLNVTHIQDMMEGGTRKD